MVTLLLTLCSMADTNVCEPRTLDIYQSMSYCEKMGIMEAAKIANTFPDGYVIKKWTCK